jgi:hypothetical protein
VLLKARQSDREEREEGDGEQIMKKLVTVSVLAMFLLAEPAHGLVLGPTNLSVLGYPESRCTEPPIPYDNDKYLWEIFKFDAEQYEKCMREYIEAANLDSQRAIEKGNEAVENFNRFVRNLKRW